MSQVLRFEIEGVEVIVDLEPYGDEGSIFVHVNPSGDLPVHVNVNGREVWC